MGWVFATYFVAASAYPSSAGGQFGLYGDGPRQESNVGLKTAWMLGFRFIFLKSTVKSTVIFKSVPVLHL